MEITTSLENVFGSSGACPGCGSLLGLKMLLQCTGANVILVTSPGEIAPVAETCRVSVVNSRNPASTARGIAAARPDANVIVYSDDAHTEAGIASLLRADENFLYVCYNNTGRVENGKFHLAEFAKSLAHKSAYAATANVGYYDDFVAKLRKAQSIKGFKFIDLFTPCPALFGFEPSNTIEIARMATETGLWPLYEAHNGVAVTKIPPSSEPVQRYLDMLRIVMPEDSVHALQLHVTRGWRALGEGKLV